MYDKLQLKHKMDHFNTRFVHKLGYPKMSALKQKLPLNNHYWAGFLQGDGSFQIKIKKPHAQKNTK